LTHYLSTLSSLREDPLTHRQQKIQRHYKQKEFREKMQQSQTDSLKDQDDDAYFRELLLVHVQFQILEMWTILDSILTEMEVSNYQRQRENHPRVTQYLFLSHKAPKNQDIPIPSIKTFRSFRLLPDSTNIPNEKLRQQVFQPGHRLPTMTIDKYLRREQQRGLILTNQK
jgi:immunoglobulin-binding protein 1